MCVGMSYVVCYELVHIRANLIISAASCGCARRRSLTAPCHSRSCLGARYVVLQRICISEVNPRERERERCLYIHIHIHTYVYVYVCIYLSIYKADPLCLVSVGASSDAKSRGRRRGARPATAVSSGGDSIYIHV